MPQSPLLPQSPFQQQIAQMAIDLAAKLEAKAKQAPRKRVLADCEALLLDSGRQFLRDALAATLQVEIEGEEKKGVPRGPAHADSPASTRGVAAANS